MNGVWVWVLEGKSSRRFMLWTLMPVGISTSLIISLHDTIWILIENRFSHFLRELELFAMSTRLGWCWWEEWWHSLKFKVLCSFAFIPGDDNDLTFHVSFLGVVLLHSSSSDGVTRRAASEDEKKFRHFSRECNRNTKPRARTQEQQQQHQLWYYANQVELDSRILFFHLRSSLALSESFIIKIRFEAAAETSGMKMKVMRRE